MRITLARHGRSAHVHAGWLSAADVHAWRVAYDAAGLREGDQPPMPLREAAARAALVVASDLPRAVESASLISGGREVVTSPVLREVPLRVPPLFGVRLPLAVWGSVIGLAWMRDLSRPDHLLHAEARARASAASAWLAGLAAQHGDVVVVTHGAFRRYLFDALLASGWHASMTRRSYHHWSMWNVEAR